MYGKIIDGVLVLAPKTISKNGFVYYNPSNEMYEAEGYLKIIEAPQPAPDEESPKYYEKSYMENDGKIISVWNETLPSENNVGVTIEDRVSELEKRVSNAENAIAAQSGGTDNG